MTSLNAFESFSGIKSIELVRMDTVCVELVTEELLKEERKDTAKKGLKKEAE